MIISQKPEGRGMGSTCSTFCNKKCVLAVFSGQNCRHFWVNFGLQHSKIPVVAQKYSSKSCEKCAKMRKTGYFFEKLYTKRALITRRSWVQIPLPQPKNRPFWAVFLIFVNFLRLFFRPQKFLGENWDTKALKCESAQQ